MPPLRLTVERGEGVDESGGVQLAKQIELLMHQRLSVRPEIEIVPCNTFERVAHKERLIERRYEAART